jgi:REP element-mobilizing transposase RayT
LATYERKCIRKKNSFDFVNGHKEHCHCLVSFGVEQTIDKVRQLIKGESSYWINKQTEFSEHLKSKKLR